MRAVRIHEWGQDPRIDLLPHSERATGESLVRIEAATVSHLDLTIASGAFSSVPRLPFVPGTSASGTIIESDTWDPGTRVYVRGAELGVSRDGTWRDQLVAVDSALWELPSDLDPAIAATFVDPVATAYVALHDIGNVQAGQRVIVTGAAGVVGALIAQLALAAEAEVIGVVSRRERLTDLPTGVKGLSADDERAVAALDDERPADLLIDTVGGIELTRRIGWVRSGGEAVLLGYTAGKQLLLDLPSWFFLNVRLSPVSMLVRGARAREIAHERLPDFVSGRLDLPVERLELSAAASAMDRVRYGRARGRVVLLPHHVAR